MVGLMVHSADIHSPPLAVAATRLCRRRLRWRKAEEAIAEDRQVDAGNHKAFRQGQRLPATATPMGCRANLCMVGSMQKARKRLRKIDRFSRSLDHDRSYPHAYQTARKILCLLNSFRIRLLLYDGYLSSGLVNP